MYIKKLLIENFRGIRKMELELHPKMNVLIGVNGAGKSSILDVLATSLSWWEAAWQRRDDSTMKTGTLAPPTWQEESFSYQDITKGTEWMSCTVHLHLDENHLDEQPWWCTRVDEINGSGNTCDLASNSASESLHHIVDTLKDFYRDHPVIYLPTDRTERHFKNSIEVQYSTLKEIDSGHVDALDTLRRLRSKWKTPCIRNSSNYLNLLFLMNILQTRENETLRQLVENGDDVSDRSLYQDPSLITIKDAWEKLFSAPVTPAPNITNFIVKENDYRPYLTCRKNGFDLSDEQLSGGEKAVIALVGSLADKYGFSSLGFNNPLNQHGIVLIDEIDLHLHPQWQRTILHKLQEIFPNTQFIVTTHSPQVVGELKSEHIIRLEDTGNGIEAFPANGETYGLTSNDILERQMKTPERNTDVQDIIENAFLAVEQGNLDRAKELKSQLAESAKNIPELISLDMRISRKEVTGK